MATTDRRWITYLVAGVLGFAGVIAAIALLSRQPQLGSDERTFHEVDALYTAVRNRDAKRLGECESRLKAARDSGTLPTAAAARLDGIIALARSGDWPRAAERLYGFMAAQRREGADETKAKHR